MPHSSLPHATAMSHRLERKLHPRAYMKQLPKEQHSQNTFRKSLGFCASHGAQRQQESDGNSVRANARSAKESKSHKGLAMNTTLVMGAIWAAPGSSPAATFSLTSATCLHASTTCDIHA